MLYFGALNLFYYSYYNCKNFTFPSFMYVYMYIKCKKRMHQKIEEVVKYVFNKDDYVAQTSLIKGDMIYISNK